ncbi:hypothetical protein DESUT3_37390 [Desulfuromonas versatilis]|uniref:histidine kinase n=1 Tax=Desulfuromonas versatilis TaxID=2802975 RepID=A0ABM8I0R0_9BACT|nr:ATP-binding protein [Desulfuromonas versatilis]BCR06670.1 hypothetical protein DESUT3_37390 [Desulfuromonas versatilis]
MRFFRGIRKKFIFIYLLFGLLPLLVISYHSFNAAADSLENLTNRQLSNLTAKTASQTSQKVHEIRKDLDLLSGFPFIQLSFLQFSFGQRLETVLFKLKKYQSQNDLYSRISLISLDGEVILSLPEDREESVAGRIDRSRLKLAGLVDTYTSGVIADHPEGPLVIFTKRVYDFEQATHPVGLLAFYIRLEALTRYVEELAPSSGGQGFVFDHQLQRPLLRGNPDFDPGPLLAGRPAAEEEVLIAEAAGAKVFLAEVPELHWTLGLTLPEKVLFGDILRLKGKSLSFALSIAALALLTTLFFVRRITNPITQLMHGAQAFSEGDLDYRIEIRGEGELRRLGEEFNAMARKIKAREKQIRQVDRLASLGILAAGVAHEVRNPLAGMKSCAQLMQRKAISGEVAQLAGGINEEIDRLDKMVRQLLDFARPKEAAPRPVRLEQVLERVLEMIGKSLQQEGIEVQADLPATPPVLVDADQAQQIFLNLALNAAQAMKGGGRLRMSLRQEDAAVLAVVADTGCGIAEEHQDRIFDPFFTTRASGTGLGLSVVHSLMTENGITWQLQSTPGGGTVFELRFAACAPEGAS